MLPVIGIFCNENPAERFFFLRQDYTDAVASVHALPLLLPLTENKQQINRCLSLCHGLILSGGGDIAPDRFPVPEEQKALFCEVNPRRDACELYAVRQAIRHRLPLLGICRGCQVLNVACGGTLVSHIDGHSQAEERSAATHSLSLVKNSRLAALSPETSPRVNSFHHQAVQLPGRGFMITARSEDGSVEAIEHRTLLFCMGVQWHPEAMKTEFSAALFSALAQAARHFQQMQGERNQ